MEFHQQYLNVLCRRLNSDIYVTKGLKMAQSFYYDRKIDR